VGSVSTFRFAIFFESGVLVVEEVVVPGVTVAAAEATVAVGDEASDVGDATVVVVGATVIVDDETGDVFDDIVNIAPAPIGVKTKSPTAVQFPGDAHETEERVVGGKSDCTPLAKTAGRASSHTPLVDVMVKAALLLFLFTKFPPAVQFPGDAHDTDVNCALGKSFWIPLANTAGRASSHTPFVDVMVKAALLLFLFRKFPTAVQFLGDAHDTELNCALGKMFWISEANTAGSASAHAPFVIVMVNASGASDILLNLPTAVQFPGDAHDTELKSAIREIG
jgi:hypothetical protein